MADEPFDLTVCNLVCVSTGARHPVRLWRDYGAVCTSLWPTTGAIAETAGLVYAAILRGTHTVADARSGFDWSSRSALEDSLRVAYRAFVGSDAPGDGVSDADGASMVASLGRRSGKPRSEAEARAHWFHADAGQRAAIARAYLASASEDPTPEFLLSAVREIAFLEGLEPAVAFERIRALLR